MLRSSTKKSVALSQPPLIGTLRSSQSPVARKRASSVAPFSISTTSGGGPCSRQPRRRSVTMPGRPAWGKSSAAEGRDQRAVPLLPASKTRWDSLSSRSGS